MTIKELQHKIAESPNKEFYQNYPLDIKFPHVSYSVSLKGVVSIYEYILNHSESKYCIVSDLEVYNKLIEFEGFKEKKIANII